MARKRRFDADESNSKALEKKQLKGEEDDLEDYEEELANFLDTADTEMASSSDVEPEIREPKKRGRKPSSEQKGKKPNIGPKLLAVPSYAKRINKLAGRTLVEGENISYTSIYQLLRTIYGISAVNGTSRLVSASVERHNSLKQKEHYHSKDFFELRFYFDDNLEGKTHVFYPQAWDDLMNKFEMKAKNDQILTYPELYWLVSVQSAEIKKPLQNGNQNFAKLIPLYLKKVIEYLIFIFQDDKKKSAFFRDYSTHKERKNGKFRKITSVTVDEKVENTKLFEILDQFWTNKKTEIKELVNNPHAKIEDAEQFVKDNYNNDPNSLFPLAGASSSVTLMSNQLFLSYQSTLSLNFNKLVYDVRQMDELRNSLALNDQNKLMEGRNYFLKVLFAQLPPFYESWTSIIRSNAQVIQRVLQVGESFFTPFQNHIYYDPTALDTSLNSTGEKNAKEQKHETEKIVSSLVNWPDVLLNYDENGVLVDEKDRRVMVNDYLDDSIYELMKGVINNILDKLRMFQFPREEDVSLYKDYIYTNRQYNLFYWFIQNRDDDDDYETKFMNLIDIEQYKKLKNFKSVINTAFDYDPPTKIKDNYYFFYSTSEDASKVSFIGIKKSISPFVSESKPIDTSGSVINLLLTSEPSVPSPYWQKSVATNKKGTKNLHNFNLTLSKILFIDSIYYNEENSVTDCLLLIIKALLSFIYKEGFYKVLDYYLVFSLDHAKFFNKDLENFIKLLQSKLGFAIAINSEHTELHQLFTHEYKFTKCDWYYFFPRNEDDAPFNRFDVNSVEIDKEEKTNNSLFAFRPFPNGRELIMFIMSISPRFFYNIMGNTFETIKIEDSVNDGFKNSNIKTTSKLSIKKLDSAFLNKSHLEEYFKYEKPEIFKPPQVTPGEIMEITNFKLLKNALVNQNNKPNRYSPFTLQTWASLLPIERFFVAEYYIQWFSDFTRSDKTAEKERQMKTNENRFFCLLLQLVPFKNSYSINDKLLWKSIISSSKLHRPIFGINFLQEEQFPPVEKPYLFQTSSEFDLKLNNMDELYEYIHTIRKDMGYWVDFFHKLDMIYFGTSDTKTRKRLKLQAGGLINIINEYSRVYENISNKHGYGGCKVSEAALKSIKEMFVASGFKKERVDNQNMLEPNTKFVFDFQNFVNSYQLDLFAPSKNNIHSTLFENNMNKNLFVFGIIPQTEKENKQSVDYIKKKLGLLNVAEVEESIKQTKPDAKSESELETAMNKRAIAQRTPEYLTKFFLGVSENIKKLGLGDLEEEKYDITKKSIVYLNYDHFEKKIDEYMNKVNKGENPPIPNYHQLTFGWSNDPLSKEEQEDIEITEKEVVETTQHNLLSIEPVSIVFQFQFSLFSGTRKLKYSETIQTLFFMFPYSSYKQYQNGNAKLKLKFGPFLFKLLGSEEKNISKEKRKNKEHTITVQVFGIKDFEKFKKYQKYFVEILEKKLPDINDSYNIQASEGKTINEFYQITLKKYLREIPAFKSVLGAAFTQDISNKFIDLETNKGTLRFLHHATTNSNKKIVFRNGENNTNRITLKMPTTDSKKFQIYLSRQTSKDNLEFVKQIAETLNK